MTEQTSSFPGVRPQWLAQNVEEVIEPELPIVDAHHHLWDKPDSRYLLDELLADTSDGHNIVATVYIQCMSMHRRDGPASMRALGETEFANGIAAMSASGQYGPTRVCHGIVGHADLRLGPEVGRLLDAHLERAGARFKGIRQIIAWDAALVPERPEYLADPDLLADAHFLEGFSQLAHRDLSFEAWLFHPQIAALTALAAAFPSTRIVLNHLGTPLGIAGHEHRRAEIYREWRRDLKDLSRCENVFVKLGGMGMRSAGMGYAFQPVPLDSSQLAASMRPFMEPCIEYFGARRCMFESNFPVDKASFSYRTCWNSFKRVASAASPADKQLLFHGSATEFYRLGLA